jgi:phosphatidylglycerol---prolipoprotein diacylglyceryl transferase
VPVNLAAVLTQKVTDQVLTQIPSPTTAVWHLGPIPIRAYALCIIAGIVAAAVITDLRMRRRGAPPWMILDIAVYAVPFGIIGGRIYHVITSPDAYFGKGGDPVKALYIWEGGLGIWGAVALGALGAWLACRQLRMPMTLVADSIAVGLPVGQAIGRLGNWFNNELYGGPTTSPWGLQIHKMDPRNPGHAEVGPDGNAISLPGLYQPTFLYELIWDVLIAGAVLLLDRRFKFGRGRAFALYVMLYTVGRGVIETIRTDEAHEFIGVRLNVWTSLVVFIGGLVYFLVKKGPQEFVIPAVEGERGFQVVTEEQYKTFVETGERPSTVASDASSSDASSSDTAADTADSADVDEPGDPSDADKPGDSNEADEAALRDVEKAEKG